MGVEVRGPPSRITQVTIQRRKSFVEIHATSTDIQLSMLARLTLQGSGARLLMPLMDGILQRNAQVFDKCHACPYKNSNST